ncbi:MAG: flagellar basal body L-ring protein FlgH [Phycisphaerales bacterium]|nr:flagellar basal body L-ring protein FlgH [Phycisphaerales bacterium]
MSQRLHWVLLIAALAAAYATKSAHAQRNTLFGGGRIAPPAPTSQPAVRPANPVAARGLTGSPAIARLRAANGAGGQKPKPNEMLLVVSPIAVDAPEPEKIKVNDQVTIIVRESKTATSDSKLESKRDWQHEWALEEWIRLSGVVGLAPAQFQAGRPSVLFKYKNDWSGDGKYDRKDELTTRIQATVIDVKPNGVLTLEATKGIQIDEEGYTIRLVGECRSRDVTPQNTILSTQVAGLSVDVKHTGAVKDAAERGWLMKALDFLKLF